MRKLANRAARPLHHGEVRCRCGFLLDADGQQLAVRREFAHSFADVGSVGQIARLAAIDGHLVDVVILVATTVLAKDDCAVVVGEAGAALSIIVRD